MSEPLGFNPERFFELAERLVGDKEYEQTARFRTAIGRSYYATFLAVRKRLEEMGYSFRSPQNIHQDVISAANEKNTLIGNKLETLRRYRVEADYQLNSQLTSEIARNCVRLSQSVLHTIRTSLG